MQSRKTMHIKMKIFFFCCQSEMFVDVATRWRHIVHSVSVEMVCYGDPG